MRPGDGRWPQPGKKATVVWLVTLGRAGYGVALVAVPGLLIGLAGQKPGRRACGVARVLGARHLIQAGVTAAAQLADPSDLAVLGGGVAVDLLHATSMVALGAVDRCVRRVTLTDAVVEMGFATAGALAAGAAVAASSTE